MSFTERAFDAVIGYIGKIIPSTEEGKKRVDCFDPDLQEKDLAKLTDALRIARAVYSDLVAQGVDPKLAQGIALESAPKWEVR